jgi:iron complex transport system ATP-binding protein
VSTDFRIGHHGTHIDVAGLVCRLGQITVLDSVTLSVPAGAICGIVGPNGAGKTTLLRAIAGAAGPVAGTVLVAGLDPRTTPAAQLARTMAVLPQRPSAPGGISVREAVAWGRSPHLGRLSGLGPDDLRLIDTALERTGTLELADRPVDALSGGELHRVLIARALAQTPRILLLDEPTVHLDITHQVEVMQLLRRLAAGGLTVIAALHDLNLAATYCDSMALISGGRLLAAGEPAAVMRSDLIERAYGAVVAVRANPVTGRPYLILSTAPAPPAGGPRVHVICGGGAGSEAMTRCVELGYRVSVGVVHIMDSDDETARALGLQIVEEAPFSPIGAEAVETATDLACGSEAVLVAPVPFGPGNLRNLEVAAAAVAKGVPVVVVDGIASRDFTGGAAAARVAELIAAGARLVPDLGGAVAVLTRLVAGS